MFHLRVLLSLFFIFVFKVQSSEFLSFSMDKGLLESLDKNQRDRVVEFLRETTNKIPISIQKYISGSWRLEFKYYSASLKGIRIEDIPSLSVPKCSVNSLHELDQEFEVYGQHNLGKLSLNIQFLKDIFDGPHKSRATKCRHKNMYRLAQATLLHELAHVIDRKLKKAASWNSSSREFHSLLDFRPYLIAGYKRKNSFEERSPDPYEMKSPSEAFAVNFEYFLMDPSFACRRPSLHEFYARIFQVIPYPKEDCKINTKALVWNQGSQSAALVDLNAQRLYRVDYLLADAGDALLSKFGHGMIRMVYCSPERKRVGPECLEDLAHHVVISYAANVDDIVINKLKGFFGGYESLQFLYKLPEIIHTYTEVELRNLFSFPINLDVYEKRRFVWRVLEKYWEYRGEYRYPTENCATEARDLLRSIMPADEAPSLNRISPLSLIISLQNRGRVTQKSEELKKIAFHYFESKENELNREFKHLLVLKPEFSSLAKNIKQYRAADPEERMRFFKRLDPFVDFKAISLLALFEEQARIYENSQQRKALAKILDQSSHPKVTALDNTLSNVSDHHLIMTNPARLFDVSSGYGIALEKELSRHYAEKIFKRSHRLKSDFIKLKSDFKIDLRLQSVTTNLIYLYDLILSSESSAIPEFGNLFN